MRKLSAAILLCMFLALQFGKVASYLYCKWQTEVVNKGEDCGCDIHLVQVFQHQDDNQDMSVQTNSLMVKLTEYPPEDFFAFNHLDIVLKSRYYDFQSRLVSTSPDSAFHPPSC